MMMLSYPSIWVVTVVSDEYALWMVIKLSYERVELLLIM